MLTFVAAGIAFALLGSDTPAEAGGSSTPVKIAVKAQPKRLAVDPRTTQVEYRLRVTNLDTEASGVVRLCARKWPHGRVGLRGKRCEAFPSLDTGESAVRVFKFGVGARARGKLSEIRLRARGPKVAAAARTVRLRVRRRPGVSKTMAVRRFEFRPKDVTVRRGERLVWKGETGYHTVTFCESSSSRRCTSAGKTGSPFGWEKFDESIAPGGRIARTAMRRGTFAYYCRPHGAMQGTITVR